MADGGSGGDSSGSAPAGTLSAGVSYDAIDSGFGDGDVGDVVQSCPLPAPASVGEPSFGESLIPIWGSGRMAINDFQNGRWGWGIVNTGMAISDVFLVKSLATIGVKAIGKGLATLAEKQAEKEAEKLAAKEAEQQAEKAAEQQAEKAAEKEAAQDAAKAEKLQAGEKGTYEELKKKPGDNKFDRDHQPSKAALLERAEELKGDPLTKAERNRIINEGDAVAVPKDVHQAGPTYAGKNSTAKIAADSKDLAGAASRDADAMVENARRLDPDNVETYQKAADQIKAKTNEDYDNHLLKILSGG